MSKSSERIRIAFERSAQAMASTRPDRGAKWLLLNDMRRCGRGTWR